MIPHATHANRKMNILHIYFKLLAVFIFAAGIGSFIFSYPLIVGSLKHEGGDFSLMFATIALAFGGYCFITAFFALKIFSHNALNQLNVALTFVFICFFPALLTKLFSITSHDGELFCYLLSLLLSFSIYKIHTSLLKKI